MNFQDILKKASAFEIHFQGASLTSKEILYIIIIIAGTHLVIWFLKIIFSLLVKRNYQKKKSHDKFLGLILFKYIGYATALIYASTSVGLSLGTFGYISAAVLVPIGLGFQQYAQDFVSGILILVEGKIKVGDEVQIGEKVGRIEDIGLRTSELVTRNNVIYVVPNTELTNARVISWTKSDNPNAQPSRYELKVGVAYHSDAQQVQKALLEVANDEHFRSFIMIKENVKGSIQTLIEDPQVIFNDFGSSSLDFILVFWSLDNWMLQENLSQMRFKVLSKFREYGIVIAFPQMDVHLDGQVSYVAKGSKPKHKDYVEVSENKGIKKP